MAGIDLFNLLGSISVNMKGFDDAMSRVKSQTQAIEQTVQNNGQNIVASSAAALDKTLKDMGASINDTGKDLTKKVTLPIAAVGVASFKAAVDFESAFAGVRKTVSTTEEGFAKLEKGIIDMSKAGPSSAVELASIMEMAGQLGIAEDHLLSFTSTMSDLSTATNMTSEQAATELSRFANITGMSQKDFDRLGSSIVALGNNFATTESEITSMAMRLSGAGAQIGLNEADIMGLSAALSSVGIKAEMGGSAISKIMVDMQAATTTGGDKLQAVLNQTGMSVRELQMMASHSGKAFGNMAEDMGMTKSEMQSLLSAGVNLENFAKVAGMTGTEFKKAFAEDAVGALGAFISGLGDAEARGTSAINMLEEMGITEVRLRDSLLRAGNANEIFAEAVDLSNKAWSDNTALSTEAAERYKTTASQLATLKNKVTAFAMEIGNILIPMMLESVKFIEPWIEKLIGLSEGKKRLIVLLGIFAAAIGPVLVGMGMLVNAVSSIIGVFGGAVGFVSKFIGIFARIIPIILRFIPGIGWVITAISLLVGAFKLAGVDILGGLAEGLKFGLNLALDAIVWVSEQIISFFKALFGIASPSKVFIGFGKDIMQGLGNGIRSMLSMVTGLFTKVFNSMKRIASSAINSIKTNASVGFANITSGARSMASNVASAVSSAFTNALTTAQGFVEKAKSLGSDIASGISNGISTGKEKVSNAISTLSQKALGVFKKDNEINSPSKLYEREAGWLPEGITRGISQGQTNVLGAMSDLVKNTNARFLEMNWDSVRLPSMSGLLANVGSMPFGNLSLGGAVKNSLHPMPQLTSVTGAGGTSYHFEGGLHIHVDQVTDLNQQQLQNQLERNFLAKARQKV